MNTTAVYSSLADDPDFSELVDLFVEEMPDRINSLVTLAQARDWPRLSQTAHQLKGAAGSYGFEDITPLAARLISVSAEGKQEEAILASLDELVSYCRRLRSGMPPQDN
jgi:histidine phosphotransfer protein HptB